MQCRPLGRAAHPQAGGLSADYAAIILLQTVISISNLVLISAGLAVIFGMMRVINFAHGEFLMLGGYTAVIATQHGVPLLLSCLSLRRCWLDWWGWRLNIWSSAIFMADCWTRCWPAGVSA